MHSGNGANDDARRFGSLPDGGCRRSSAVFKQSQRSHMLARSLCSDDIADVDTTARDVRTEPPAVAPCPPTRRSSVSNEKSSSSEKVRAEHAREARSTYDTLFVHVKTKRRRPNTSNHDRHDVFYTLLKKYLDGCVNLYSAPCLDDVHNISLAVHEAFARQTTEQRDGCKIVSDLKTKAVNLVVALWTCVRTTPHIASSQRRRQESFRIVCAGSYFGFRRGITLECGTVVVPRIQVLGRLLPTKSDVTRDDKLRRTLVNSYRGLCAIHRCIASVARHDAYTTFERAIRASAEFEDERCVANGLV